jgi:hypothetical protein
VQDRTGDVVGHVGHDLERRRDQRGDLLVEDVALDERQAGCGDRVGVDPAEPVRQAPVEFDGRDCGAAGEQAAGQDAEPGPDLQDALPGPRSGQIEDRFEHVRICQEILRQGAVGPEAFFA